MTHQDCVEELVAQVEANTGQEVKIQFYHEGVARVTEYLLEDVKLEDGVIRCRLQVS